MDYDEADTSLPFIDDTTDDELTTNQSSYNLKIIENYQNKNRNIEITNQHPEDTANKSLSPVAPLAEETDTRLSEEDPHDHIVPNKTGVKLVIRGWHSTISIQGLDNRSSITFKRKNERMRQEMGSGQRKEKQHGGGVRSGEGNVEKPKKGRWKMLTRSLISKSARFERRTDERYPKYVLLKDEEELEEKVEESYPKMVVFGERRSKKAGKKQEVGTKTEFNLKKSFNNKTKPIVPMEEILQKGKNDKKDNQTEKRRTVTVKKKMVVDRRKSVAGKTETPAKEPTMVYTVSGCSQNQVFNEIQDILEDTLKLYPGMHHIPTSDFHQEEQKRHCEQPPLPEDFYTSLPPQYCQVTCHEPCCYPAVNQPPVYIPVYNPYSKPRHSYRQKMASTEGDYQPPSEVLKQEEVPAEREVDIQNLPFGILSSFFPHVVIMKTYQGADGIGKEEKINDDPALQSMKNEDVKISSEDKEDTKVMETLEVPLPDLTMKSTLIQEQSKNDRETRQFLLGDAGDACCTNTSLNEISSSDEEHKTKTDESEATEYLHFREEELVNNESKIPPPPWSYPQKPEETSPQKVKSANEAEEESPKNLTLTKIGYKMYDNLTKLSLKREKEIIDTPEIHGCGCGGNGTKKSPYNITLESNNKVIKVTVPEDELNLQIMNAGGQDVQIGVTSSQGDGVTMQEVEGVKIVRKEELWHSDEGRKGLVVKNEEIQHGGKDAQKIKLTLPDNKEVVLCIQESQKEERKKEKMTKEIKVGTDDFLAGGDFASALGSNYKNLSPRTGQLLRSLQEKLEFGERERKLLTEKVKEKVEGSLLPGIFLVKQISPRTSAPKKSFEVPSLKKQKKITESTGQLREYYCEECLATMRIFEDENPSVKSMVDKFETIIQLESY